MLSPSLTAPLYIAENDQEQIANLDGAIFKLRPNTQWFIDPTLPFSFKKKKKKPQKTKKTHIQKKKSKNLRDPFQTVHVVNNSHLATQYMDMVSFTKLSVSKKEIKAIRFAA